MTFDIDRRTVTEGDIVEIKWDCTGAEQVKLNIDNGFRSTDMPLETTGSKRFRLNRSKGRTRLTIVVTIDGKEHRKSIHVRVKPLPTVKAETVDTDGKKLGFLHRWTQQALTKWHNLTAKAKFALSVLPEGKQVIVKLMALIGVMLIVSTIWPKLYSAMLFLLIAFLLIGLFRR